MTPPVLVSSVLPDPVRTPLLRRGGLRVKAEVKQWSGSVKYRMVYAKVCRALREGVLEPGTVLAEVTSGSTGVALAYVGRLLGRRVELHTTPGIAADKRERILSQGAKLVVHPEGTDVGALLEELRRKSEKGGLWHLGQYDRASLVFAYEDLGRELLDQLVAEGGEPPSVFACPVGTGGLIQGVGAALRGAYPGIRVVAIEPRAGECIDGIRNTELLHLGAGDPYDRDFPDEVIRMGRPRTPGFIQGIPLGESGTAVLEALAARAGGELLMISPD